MIEKIISLFKPKNKKGRAQDSKPKSADAASSSPYTKEEADKVKERLQGLGYID